MIQTTKITSKNYHILKDKDYIQNLDLSLSGYVNGAPGTQCLNVIYFEGGLERMCTHVPDLVDGENIYSTFSSDGPTQLSQSTISASPVFSPNNRIDCVASSIGQNTGPIGVGAMQPRSIKVVNTGIEFAKTDSAVLALGPLPFSTKIDYRFGEDKYIDELKSYIDATYGAHYAGKVGPMDMMIAGGQALGFIVGSIIKYAFRLGKKDNYKRDDVLKIAHYAILLLHAYDVLKLGDKKDG